MLTFPSSPPPTIGQEHTTGGKTWVWDGARWAPKKETLDFAEAIHAAPAKSTPADADEFGYVDSAAGWRLVKLTWANLKTWLANVFLAKTGGTLTGDLNFSGIGRRITGDFSNASVASRTALQTSSVNGATSLVVLPNGSGAASGVGFYTKQDPENSESIQVYAVAGGAAVVSSVASGTGVMLPLSLQVGGLERLRIDPTTGSVLAVSGPLGYGPGAGGSVVQATSKSTAVTLNKPSGQIQMHSASLGAGASAVFTLVNDKIEYGSTLGVSLYEGGGASNYRIECVGVNSGSATIRLTNVSAVSRAESVYVYFNVIVGIAG